MASENIPSIYRIDNSFQLLDTCSPMVDLLKQESLARFPPIFAFCPSLILLYFCGFFIFLFSMLSILTQGYLFLSPSCSQWI